MSPRTYLYVPGDRPERFPKAVASGADAVILDLEDAVAVRHKDAARGHVEEALAALDPGPVQIWVRINTGPRGAEDLQALAAGAALTGVVVPKATPDALDRLAPLLDDLPVVGLVESATAVLGLPTIAGHPRITRLAMGEVDLAADLGVRPTVDGRLFEPIRLAAVVASAAHQLESPVGPVYVDVGDLDGLRHSTETLRDLGFWARQAVHPAQVAVINEVLTPTAEEIDAAETLLGQAQRAEAAGDGVYVDERGRMVDEAVVRSARRLLDRVHPTDEPG